MQLRRRHYVLFALAALTAAFYYLFIGRAHESVERDGWIAEVSYRRIACPHCSGYVHRLECNGRPVSLPKLTRGHRLFLRSPVGVFEAYRDYERWTFHSTSNTLLDTEQTVRAEELNRGYYEVQEPTFDGKGNVRARKRGTPAHWCLASSELTRMVDPALIDQLEWALPTPASAPETSLPAH